MSQDHATEPLSKISKFLHGTFVKVYTENQNIIRIANKVNTVLRINPRFPVFPKNFISLASDEHLIIITWLVTVSLIAAP
jgi:hypothetical protein